jgi:ABC-2 type transport system permease protein
MARGRFLVAVTDYATQVLAVADAEARKLRHDPWELLSRAIQPVLWLVLFGGVMAQVRGLSSGTIPYLDFLAPGILAQSVLFVAIFYGISAIWERDLGVLHRYMVSPAPRSALVIGKALSSSIRGLSQAVVIYLCAALMGVNLDLDPRRIVLVIVRHARSWTIFHLLADHCLHREDARALHGDRAGPDDADLLRQQRNLSPQPHAGMAENYLIAQPAHL